MEYYIENKIGQVKVAQIDNDEMLSFKTEVFSQKSLVGGIYIGRIVEINKAQSIAIVDIGETNAILNNFNKLTQGQNVLVQVIRDGFNDKLPALHTRISIENRFFKISNQAKGFGFDNRAGNGKIKSELEKIASSVIGDDNGVVVKTNCVNVNLKNLEKSYSDLRNEHDRILNHKTDKVGIVKKPLTLLEKCINESIYASVFVTDCLETLSLLKSYKNEASDITIKHFKDGDLYEQSGINDVIEKLLQRSVDLQGGGNIVIDETEAITAIDVNGSDFKNLNKGDDALFKLNKKAVKEIAKQIILRNLSGLIVVDFVRLKNRGMAKQLPKILKSELQRIDSNVFDVMDITKAGLVEITRKRTSPSISEIYLNKPIPQKNLTIICLELLQKLIYLNGVGTPTVYAPINIVNEMKKDNMIHLIDDVENRIKKKIEFIIDNNIGVALKK
ncbi:MAG: ribonuclease E/G [Alphaproteobacteria bacterium]|nr:ribonuclease E/G [Alphaproteobacteria bacterium]